MHECERFSWNTLPVSNILISTQHGVPLHALDVRISYPNRAKAKLQQNSPELACC
jgi:hypothetical protein